MDLEGTKIDSPDPQIDGHDKVITNAHQIVRSLTTDKTSPTTFSATSPPSTTASPSSSPPPMTPPPRLEDEFHHLMIRNSVSLDAVGLHSSIRLLSFASDLDKEFDTSNDGESSVDQLIST